MATNGIAGNAGAHRSNGSSAPNSDNTSTQDASPDVAELEADIERTRADLADTVDQLTAKLDVKTRVRNSVADTKENVTAQLCKLQDHATDDEGKPTTATVGIGVSALAAVVAVLVVALWRRTHTPRRPKRRRH
jgi:hypothetical protein